MACPFVVTAGNGAADGIGLPSPISPDGRLRDDAERLIGADQFAAMRVRPPI
ncbi:hypothetical protein GCM10028812_51220 [Ancylobacter sonchi]